MQFVLGNTISNRNNTLYGKYCGYESMLSVLNAPFKTFHMFRLKNIQTKVIFTSRRANSEKSNKSFEDDIYLLSNLSPVLEREFRVNKCCELFNKISVL